MDVIKVEPLTTARALRGPFDYRRARGMESVGIGSILEVPFGRQRLRAVVTGLAASSSAMSPSTRAPKLSYTAPPRTNP